MAEMVGSAVAQEFVSGAFSLMRNNHKELASQSHLKERLKMAHLELKLSLERSMKMPITEVSLLQQRMMIKHAFEECTLRVNLEGEDADQGEPLSPSLPKRIMRAVKPFFSTRKGLISGPCVKRFEWFAEKAEKFVRDVESGCSPDRYRFSSPLITQLLEGKYLDYRAESGSQTLRLSAYPSCLEEYGAVAYLAFEFKDLKTPMNCFRLHMMLRLSESTDIVGISTKCLQSLETEFKPVADVASGELAQISTQVGFFLPAPAGREFIFNRVTNSSRIVRQEPLCCIGDRFQPSSKNTVLADRFPEQVSFFFFERLISATKYTSRFKNSTEETNNIKTWPILQLSATFQPHFLQQIQDDKVRTYLDRDVPMVEIKRTSEEQRHLDLSEMAELVPYLAVVFFMIRPKRTEYNMRWCAPHGRVTFTVSKPSTEIGCSPEIGEGSKTRRVSKRKR